MSSWPKCGSLSKESTRHARTPPPSAWVRDSRSHSKANNATVHITPAPRTNTPPPAPHAHMHGQAWRLNINKQQLPCAWRAGHLLQQSSLGDLAAISNHNLLRGLAAAAAIALNLLHLHSRQQEITRRGMREPPSSHKARLESAAHSCTWAHATPPVPTCNATHRRRAHLAARRVVRPCCPALPIPHTHTLM